MLPPELAETPHPEVRAQMLPRLILLQGISLQSHGPNFAPVDDISALIPAISNIPVKAQLRSLRRLGASGMGYGAYRVQ